MNKIITLFILLILLTSFNIKTQAKNMNNIIYVDDDNIEGPWDGSIVHPYQHVEDAVDVATNGSTIFVFNGTYYERFRIQKSIKLQGENNKETILWEECFHVLYVESCDVEICGFTILGNYSTQSAICVKGNGANEKIMNISIHDNRIISNRNGIISESSQNISIYNNMIIDNDQGITLEGDNNKIFENVILGSKYHGLSLTGNNSEIYDNIIFSNENGIIPEGTSIRIHDNEIINNVNDGIMCSTSTNVSIFNNHISDNYNGISFQKEACAKATIFRNYIIGNQVGILSDKSSSDLHIFRNEVSKNEIFGIIIIKDIEGIIEENNFIDNGENIEKCRIPLFRRHALFVGFVRLTQTPFDSNYWDNYKGWGKFYIPAIGVLPGFLKDFNPVTQPYDVS